MKIFSKKATFCGRKGKTTIKEGITQKQLTQMTNFFYPKYNISEH
jgi:hypothetical protein